jgi:hypothetical protein
MRKVTLLSKLVFIIIMFVFVQCGDNSDSAELIPDPVVTTIKTFDKTHLNFGGDGVQSKEASFNFPVNSEKIEEILMFVKLECPDGVCGAWDVFANIKVKDPSTNNWLEMGRYITPYGVDNSQRVGGFIFDVTDFKSLLTGTVQLKSFIEVWTAEGWLLTVDFKVTEGNPTYKYSEIVPLIDYTNNSQQIPYGEPIPNDIKLNGSITIPANTKTLKLRSIISGWGHATPFDADGRPSAEWGFRNHNLTLGTKDFIHIMGPIGCGNNPVSPQNGNWAPDRAGWCPGQEVPIRVNTIANFEAGKTVEYNYKFQDWTNDGKNGSAFYSLSTFLVIESDTPILKPTIN